MAGCRFDLDQLRHAHAESPFHHHFQRDTFVSGDLRQLYPGPIWKFDGKVRLHHYIMSHCIPL
jgi:hypothetical protein